MAQAAAWPPDRDRLIALSEVSLMTGLGRSMLYRLKKQGRFPQPYKPGGHASRWSETEVREWVATQRRVA